MIICHFQALIMPALCFLKIARNKATRLQVHTWHSLHVDNTSLTFQCLTVFHCDPLAPTTAGHRKRRDRGAGLRLRSSWDVQLYSQDSRKLLASKRPKAKRSAMARPPRLLRAPSCPVCLPCMNCTVHAEARTVLGLSVARPGLYRVSSCPVGLK
jgi:hypothetical protein